MSKNTLSKNTPVKSSLNDIEIDSRLGDSSFNVEVEDSYIPEKQPDYKWNMTEDSHKLRAVSYDKIEEVQYWQDDLGNEHEIAPHWSIGMEDIRTGEFDYIEFPITPKAERSFKLAVNTRSGRDLARKAFPNKVEALTMRCVIEEYLAKYPVEFRYGQNHYVDEQTGEAKVSKPKILLWNPEDFQPRYRSKNWISLR